MMARYITHEGETLLYVRMDTAKPGEPLWWDFHANWAVINLCSTLKRMGYITEDQNDEVMHLLRKRGGWRER